MKLFIIIYKYGLSYYGLSNSFLSQSWSRGLYPSMYMYIHYTFIEVSFAIHLIDAIE